MPTYEYYCETCDCYFDMMTTIAERNNVQCSCGRSASRVYTRKISLANVTEIAAPDQAGQTFASVRELEAYARSRGKEVVSDQDSSWRKLRDRIRDNAEKAARTAGFRDLEHRRAVRREQKRNGHDGDW